MAARSLVLKNVLRGVVFVLIFLTSFSCSKESGGKVGFGKKVYKSLQPGEVDRAADLYARAQTRLNALCRSPQVDGAEIDRQMPLVLAAARDYRDLVAGISPEAKAGIEKALYRRFPLLFDETTAAAARTRELYEKVAGFRKYYDEFVRLVTS